MTALAAGTGPVLVLVHGALGDLRQWESFAGFLPLRTVISLSRRFHWPNPAATPDSNYSVDSHRDDLLALLETLSGPVDLVGHSYGALVVLAAAQIEPRRVRSLVLLEPPIGGLLPPSPELDAEHASRGVMLASVRANVATGRHEDAASALADWVQESAGGISSLSADVRQRLLDNAMTVGPTYAVAPPVIDSKQLGELTMPVLIVNGERTRTFYRRAAEAAAACIAHAQLCLIADAGHMLIVEQPEATASRVRVFLHGVDAASRV